MRRWSMLAVALLLLPCVGCNDKGTVEKGKDGKKEVVAAPIPDTPVKAAEAFHKGLAEGKPQAAWDALPASYQKDVEGLIHEFAGKMDPEVWNGGFGVAKKFVRVLKEKKEFILANPLWAFANIDPKVVGEHWDGVVESVGILVDSDVSDLGKLKTLSVQEYLSDTGAELMGKVSTLANAAKNEEFKKGMEDMKNTKFSLVSSEGDKAVIKVEAPNKPAEETAMVKVEGKWIPQDMADGWAQSMKDARENLAKMTPEEMAKNKEQVMGVIQMADAKLNVMLDAKTPEEFNGHVMEVVGTFMGGGGGPPAGGPGPGDFAPPSEGDEKPEVPAGDEKPATEDSEKPAATEDTEKPATEDSEKPAAEESEKPAATEESEKPAAEDSEKPAAAESDEDSKEAAATEKE